MWKGAVVASVTSLAVVVALVIVENVATARLMPRLARFPADVSAAYLRRDIDELAGSPPQILFFGDSVVWGYRLPVGETAVSMLAGAGCACRNLALRAGSPPNDFALARSILTAGVRPRQIVLEIDQKALNPADRDYNRLLPGVDVLAADRIAPGDRALLTPTAGPSGAAAVVERALESVWLPYAMRTDIRDTFFNGEVDAPFTRPTPDLYEGTYDLTPLTDDNVGVHFLEMTVELYDRAGIPVLAFLTPTNHTLLHEYIDSRAYVRNERFLERALASRGASVVNLDTAFPASLFIDNAHLTAAGQAALARALRPRLQR